MEKCRVKVNKHISKFVLSVGGIAIRHRVFERDAAIYFRSDGVHITEVGLDLFNLALQEGVEQAIALGVGKANKAALDAPRDITAILIEAGYGGVWKYCGMQYLSGHLKFDKEVEWALCFLALLDVDICESSKLHKKHHQHQHHHQQQHHHPHNCFTGDEGAPQEVIRRFVGNKMSWSNYISVKLVSYIEKNEGQRRRRKREQDQGCPVEQFSPSTELNKRSISPWGYRIDIDENRFPQKLAFANCLCDGCIHTHGSKAVENRGLVSVPIEQTMLVLRRKTCPQNHTAFTFEVEYIKVPVGCTCAKPRYAS
ncbi:interleukin-17C [Pelodytes ibericus]